MLAKLHDQEPEKLCPKCSERNGRMKTRKSLSVACVNDMTIFRLEGSPQAYIIG